MQGEKPATMIIPDDATRTVPDNTVRSLET